MAIVVEDGTGLANADALASEAEVTAYFVAYGLSTQWTSASTSDREIAIRKCTQYLEVAADWEGVRKFEEQALAWPRYWVFDQDGYLVSDFEVPIRVKQALAEVIRRYLVDPNVILPDESSVENSVKRTSVKVGPLEEEVEYAGGVSVNTSTKLFPLVWKLLKPFLRTSGSERS